MKGINIIIDKNDKTFVEVENDSGQSISIGIWRTYGDYAILRITEEDIKNSKGLHEKENNAFSNPRQG